MESNAPQPRLHERILLGLAHALDRRIDRKVRASMPGEKRRSRRVWAVLLLIVVAIAPAISMVPVLRNIQSPPQPVAAVSAAVQQFRADLPESAEIDAKTNALTASCTKGRSVERIARQYLKFSRFFTRSELARAIVEANPQAFRRTHCQRDDERIAIPQPLLKPIQNKALGWSAHTPVRAVYLRGDNTRPERLRREVARLKAAGGNGVVFDVKDIIGVVNYRSSVPEVEKLRRHAAPIKDLAKTIQYLHSQNIYVIARMACFQDENLAVQRPDLAIKDRGAKNGILLVKGKPLWVDAGQMEVRRYNLKIVQELVVLGVDEIQFDYIRYPAEGNLSKVVYHKLPNANYKTNYLANFLAGAYLMTRFADVHTSIDIFGIVAWGEEVDIRQTGQRISRMAPFVDVISPMLYPSHFNRGFDGFDSPADEGYHFYHKGAQRVLELSEKPGMVVRPWLQAFRWRVTNYNEDYIRDQIKGNHEGGGLGWMMWNAGNDYGLVYRALRDHDPERGVRSGQASE